MNFAVIGDPISHTMSPLIHRANFKALQLDADYQALHVTPDHLSVIRDTAIENELSGFNVTVPHKENIMKYLDEVDLNVKQIGAVNTVHIKDGKYIGHNTDVSGYKSAYLDTFKDRRRKILILGAGGAAKAVHRAHSDLGDEIYIYARRKESFERFITDDFTPVSSVENLNYDVIINATPVGLKDEDLFEVLNLDAALVNDKMIGIDLIYNPEKTKFLTYFNQKKTMNGLPMLVYQAMHAFKIWTGIDGDYQAVNKALKSHLGG